MTEILLSRYIETLKKPNVYTPVVEAIVNGIQSILFSGRLDGKVQVKIIRDSSLWLTDDEDAIIGFDVSDNWQWFSEANTTSWKKVLSDAKIDKGWKWLWRISYLQCFDEVKVESRFVESTKFYEVKFDMRKSKLDDNYTRQELTFNLTDNQTTIFLHRWEKNYLKNLNSHSKTLDTFSRKILEKLLVFFVDDKFSCPRIEIHDWSKILCLNDLSKQTDLITSELNQSFSVELGEQKKDFQLKLFKVYYAEESHHLFLCANNIIVKEDSLVSHIRDLKDVKDFIKDNHTMQHNYSLKCYILWDYLDQSVDYQRMWFDFSLSNEVSLLEQKDIIDENNITQKAIELIKEHYKTQLESLKEKKKKRVEQYVEQEAIYYKHYLEEVDLDSFNQWMTNYDIEQEFHKIEFAKRQEVLNFSKKVSNLSDDKKEEEMDELVSKYTDLQKTDLARYVSMRKVIIDLFDKYLKLNEKEKYEKEDVIHKLIYPMRTNSEKTTYWQHNLRILDERLSFYEYISSDQKLEKWKKKSDRGDIICFDKPIATRGWDDLHNPITVFELKKPQRDWYSKDDDPILQIAKYVKQIREKKMKNFEGKTINANDTTPAYWFILCDITDKIDEFATNASLKKTSDWLWYVWYHPWHDIYFEIMSYDKLIKDAKQRNAILFHKLWLK
jgi:hypothetical protein